jgi:hypothetical protein
LSIKGEEMAEQLIGTIEHFYGKPSVGMIRLSDILKKGDTIHIKGKGVDFIQQVSSMRIEFTDVAEAKSGDLVGVKVEQKVHKQDEVYKVTD